MGADEARQDQFPFCIDDRGSVRHHFADFRDPTAANEEVEVANAELRIDERAVPNCEIHSELNSRR
jgi:hypothetical protein